ncbi:MAG: sulfurtransferase [Fluviicola sp.]|nr:MAG: sulfurtransferase [Fluviicola sp.]
MKKAQIYLLTILSVLVFTTGFAQETEGEEVVIETVDKEAFKFAIASGEYVIFDVRTVDEYMEGHIENAKSLDVLDDQFEKTISNIDKAQKYLIYCKSGGRSQKALEKMKDAGFVHVLELEGGYLNWNK